MSDVMDIEGFVAAVDAALRAEADPERADHERAYLKSDLDFLGVSVPTVRAVVLRELAAVDPGRTGDDVLAAADALWAAPVHERRLAAVELLARDAARLAPGALVPIERFLREARTWALVDPLAIRVAGRLVARHPELGATLDRWADDPDLWLRRAALLSLLGPLRAGEGDVERFTRYADGMLGDQEFFVRKAIGWVLRDTGRRRPELVEAWVRPRLARLSGVTFREALKPLTPEVRVELDEARRAALAAPAAATGPDDAAVRRVRQRHGLAAAFVAGAMVGLRDALEDRPDEEVPIVVDSPTDPTDIDVDGVRVEAGDQAFAAPPLPPMRARKRSGRGPAKGTGKSRGGGTPRRAT